MSCAEQLDEIVGREVDVGTGGTSNEAGIGATGILEVYSMHSDMYAVREYSTQQVLAKFRDSDVVEVVDWGRGCCSIKIRVKQ